MKKLSLSDKNIITYYILKLSLNVTVKQIPSEPRARAGFFFSNAPAQHPGYVQALCLRKSERFDGYFHCLYKIDGVYYLYFVLSFDTKTLKVSTRCVSFEF